MTIYILVACSKSKTASPPLDLTWSESTNLTQWSQAWSKQKGIHKAKDLYSGRSCRKQIELCSDYENVDVRIISAGAGLISPDDMIPPYEATFLPNKGPDLTEWHELPMGGLGNINLLEGDKIVSFAPGNYHRALLEDPHYPRVSKFIVAASTSPLSVSCGFVIKVHSRSREVLGAASIDLNTRYLELYLHKGLKGFEDLYSDAAGLPPKQKRRRVSETELKEVVRDNMEVGSLNALVRRIRDDLQYSASYERIREIRSRLRSQESKS
jgi:hypothetical protein